MKSMNPFLTFEGRAEEALDYYAETFRDAEVLLLQKYDAAAPGLEGKVAQGAIRIHDQLIRVMDSQVPHEFTFTPSMSFFIECETSQEMELYYRKLKNKGAIHMPLDDYGFSRQFAWIQDQFGVTWQLNLS
ncbi:VOC family protein [Salinicoccus hispanicus]|uniref:VOC family protein n=1 Tax=Salinicoccus hispanicus TaxID=157225 RepID=A0A6N8U8T7_9STAP|nr:VOC family protein [Salinicoccus hispanicus]MXQ52099.1 VOC family protein [Salinicoccus hispanicus]